ncbi:hypothetical protein [Streptomyces sp. NPDC091212]|uniref:hypothetical protein n=1 Tax=Streptomyces sp. NPDC091212 TaxID=3155191 RepID=UPI0034167DFA
MSAADFTVLPVFGPTGVANVHDDASVSYGIIRIDYLVSREELFAALVMGFTDTNPERDPAVLSVNDVRREVEGTLATASGTDVTRFAARLAHVEGRTVEQEDRLHRLSQALDRAYPPAPYEAAGAGRRLSPLDRATVERARDILVLPVEDGDWQAATRVLARTRATVENLLEVIAGITPDRDTRLAVQREAEIRNLAHAARMEIHAARGSLRRLDAFERALSGLLDAGEEVGGNE